MKITMLTTIPGTADGQWLREGLVIDVNEKLARFLISEKQAEPYPKPEPAEQAVRTADVAAPENAAKRPYNRKSTK